jgi:hypothetical protein
MPPRSTQHITHRLDRLRRHGQFMDEWHAAVDATRRLRTKRRFMLASLLLADLVVSTLLVYFISYLLSR